MINVALIGFGLSGRYLQAPFFESNPNFKLKVILSNSQNPAEYFPQVKVVKNIEEVIADENIELISICSPNDTHYKYAKLALVAGKHVMVEKPFTVTSKEAEELIILAQQRKKVLAIFQNRRFDSDFLTVQKLIASGDLGEILNLEIHYNRFKPELNVKKWKEDNSPGSGIIYDLGAHIIDQVISLFGVPKKITGQTFAQRQHSLIDDAFDIKLDYGKLKVTLTSSLMVRHESPRYIINGSKASFVKYGIDVQEDHLKAGKKPTDKDFGVEPIIQEGFLYFEENGLRVQKKVQTLPGNWALLFQNLYEAIAHNTALIIKPTEVLEQIKIIETVKQQS
jgi:scyllo-inositol 2-dehydrogenase (NADP+)